jgi:hypothetical protein
MLPSVSTVSRAACRHGSSAFAVRPSVHGLGGYVAAVGFVRFSQAAQFARTWAVRLPPACGGCAVKRAGGLVWVSVPVLPASAPVLCRRGAPVAVAGSPPACRQAVAGCGVWAW